MSPRISSKGNSRYLPAILVFSQREQTHIFPLCGKGKPEIFCNSLCSTDNDDLSKSLLWPDLASRSQFNTTNVISVLCLRLDSDCWFNVLFKLDAYYLLVWNWKPEMGPKLKGFWHLVPVSSGFSEEIYFLIRFFLIWNGKVCNFLPERTQISFKIFDKYFSRIFILK